MFWFVQILPTDSLAGVALKYGITVAQILKCNKMWASNSIHLRKFLYIPLHVADTSKILVPACRPQDLKELSRANLSEQDNCVCCGLLQTRKEPSYDKRGSYISRPADITSIVICPKTPKGPELDNRITGIPKS